MQHPDVRKAADAAAATALAQRTTVAGAESGGGDGGRHEGSVTVEGRGGLFRRDDQRLLVLLTKYVLVKSEVGKEVRAPVEHNMFFFFSD